MNARALIVDYWPVGVVGAVLVAPWAIDQLTPKTAPATAPAPEAVTTVDGVALEPSDALRAAINAYPARVLGVTINKRRNALSDCWPQIRARLLAAHGAAGGGTRATQPALDSEEAADVVSAILGAAQAGARAAGYRGAWSAVDFGLASPAVNVQFFEHGADLDSDNLTTFGRAYKQASSAAAILARANFGGDTLSPLMLQNCTDAAQRLADVCDESSYALPINWPSVIESIGEGVTSLPDTLSDAGGYVVDKATGLVGDAVGAILFSTPVLLGVVAFAWWKLA